MKGEADDVDTYLYWALNTLLQELFDPGLAAANNAQPNALFQSFLTPVTTPTPTASVPMASVPVASIPSSAAASPPTVAAPSGLPIPEAASFSVQAAIQNAAASTGLSPALLKAVATVESGLDPNVVSSAGAVGLMQLMPQTAQSLGVNPNNLAQNALGGAEYLKSLLGQFGQNVSLALAAYNAGPGAVEQYGGIPPYAQTQQYVNDVLSTYRASSATAATPANSSWTG